VKDLTLTAIVPIFNEEKYLLDSVTRLQKTNIFNEIILIDNCSTDASLAIAQNLKEKDSSILVLQTKNNDGKASAVQLGLNYVKTSHVVIHDADLEYFPDDIVEMFEVAKVNPNDLILGSRVIGNKERKNIYFTTYFGNRILSIMFSFINRYKVSDISTCYQMYSLKNIQKLNLNEKGFGMELEVLSKFIKLGIEIIEVPIKYEGRSYSEGKKIKLSDALNIAFKMIKYSKLNLFS
tara:strand:- start:12587 stop:13294 length:708 start_codon:yes stop_codon:yes gene_type:complete